MGPINEEIRRRDEERMGLEKNGLKIAVISNTLQDGKRFIECKFKNKIYQVRLTTSTYLLKNGDILYNCYKDSEADKWKDMEFDAFVVHPLYESMLDVIRVRSAR